MRIWRENFSQRPGACRADRVHHLADRALEHRRPDRPNRQLDESSTHWTSGFGADQASGPRNVSSAGSRSCHSCGKSEHRPFRGRTGSAFAGLRGNRCGPPTASLSTYRSAWKTESSSWFRTASRTSTCEGENPLRWTCRPVDWSPRLSRYCAPAMGHGSRTVRAMPIEKPSMRTTACWCLRTIRITRCGGYG